jgi:peptidylprolyl isomerase domain and WD repeat-containing protein 1
MVYKYNYRSLEFITIGHVKFWKKSPEGVEFVKHFRAHLGEIVAFDVSFEGALLCTAAKDKVLDCFYHRE